MPGGRVELFVSEHMTDGQRTREFMMSQCTSDSFDRSIDIPMADNNMDSGAGGGDDSQPWLAPQAMATGAQALPWDLYASHLNLFDRTKDDDVLHDGSTRNFFLLGNLPPPLSESMVGNGFPEDALAYQQSLLTTASNLHCHNFGAESSVTREIAGHGKESLKMEGNARIESGSEGSDDDEEHRPARRSGKQHCSKNLFAERKRRKKLNDRLYALRALVPKITKMDRASILGDAIEYVMDLQKQVKDLQDELEETNQEDDGHDKQIGSNLRNSNSQMDVPIPNGWLDHDDSGNNPRTAAAADDNKPSSDKGQQMEPQVEVRQLEANEFFLKVLCEHKQGGFSRLLEAMSSLGLEVTNVSVTTYGSLVLNVFRVERRDDEVVEADRVRDSLLEVTRDPQGWSGLAQAVEYQQQHPQHGHSHHELGFDHHLHYLHHQA
ncbi:transcription factor ABORTED MICROSPORES-like isoform X3 [Musa acuminata AAA Group]|uniref:transcription factor ABORTED MICROSPORES-like isoform X3 n=1 Tax=Musa acuminata AAA Group TaxID=214697 RepID=UPI0031D70322